MATPRKGKAKVKITSSGKKVSYGSPLLRVAMTAAALTRC